MWDWSEEFRAHSLQHLVVILVSAGIIGAWCVIGRLILKDEDRGRAREARMRKTIGWVVIVSQVLIHARRLMPDALSWEDSLPLHLCRLVVWVCAWSLITLDWRGRSVTLFMGLGLCGQIYLTPFLEEGHGHLVFWTYWWNHLVIVGIAVYDIVVLGYRPGKWDLWFSCWSGLGYAILVSIINRVIGTNYSYYGQGTHEGVSAVDFMGPYPWRIPVLAGAAGVVFVVIFVFSQTAMFIRVRALGMAPPLRIEPPVR